MPISTPTFKPKGSVSIIGSENPVITNLSIIDANTEYSHTLQNNLKQLIIKARGFYDLKIAFIVSESSTKYFTIPKGNSLALETLLFAGKTIYLQSSNASVVAEILEFN